VSFPLRVVIDLVPSGEAAAGAKARGQRRAWLAARDYKVIEVSAADVESDVAGCLERIDRVLG
jgi:tRNA/rRNA methyltransferase